jgi:hypothetical protein
MSTVDRCRKAAKASNATDPGKAAGSHFIEKKNRDSMPSLQIEPKRAMRLILEKQQAAILLRR